VMTAGAGHDAITLWETGTMKPRATLAGKPPAL
jgi:hypothetical protein